MGGAVLVVGLLLILAGLASARLPGGASFAPSGVGGLAQRARNPIRAFLLSPIHPATWYANASIGLGFFVGIFAFAALASLASAGFATLVFGVGIVFLAMVIEGSRLVARIERRRMTLGGADRLLAHPYRRLGGGVLDILRTEFADESRWRDVLYVAVNFPLAIIEFVVILAVWSISLSLLTLPLWYDGAGDASLLPTWLAWLGGRGAPFIVLSTLAGAALLPVAASLSQLVMALHRAVVAGLLCTSESRELRRQVASLKESRSAVLDVEASELHRIERDLHDGAQQRLVMLTIDLGLASERIDTDPAAAKGAHPRRTGAGPRGAGRAPRPGSRDRPIHPARSRAGAGAQLHHRPRARADGRPQRPCAWGAAARGDRAGGLFRRRRGAGERGQAQQRQVVRGALPPGGLTAGRRGLGRRCRWRHG